MSTMLDLGSDKSLRFRLFTKASLEHPAKLHLGLLQWIVERYTRPGDTIADPMAGIGSTAYAALLQRDVILRDVEPKWLALAHENAAQILREAGLFAGAIDVGQADARNAWGFTVDHIITSPPYACRAAPNAQTRVGTLPHRVRAMDGQSMGERWHKFLAQPTAGSAGALRFFYGDHPAQIGAFRGERYWLAMERIYTQARAALRPGGSMVLVIKDHIRDGQRIYVATETAALCERLGFRLVEQHARLVYPLSLWQRRRKERGEPIVEDETVLVFR